MGFLGRDELLKKEKLQVERVDVGEDHVFVRQMTARERDRFEQSLMKEVKDDEDGEVRYERNLEDFRAKLAVNTICDENGNNILEPGDFQKLSQAKSAATMEKIVNAAQKLNKISEKDKEKLTKNSEGDRKGVSTSGSQKS